MKEALINAYQELAANPITVGQHLRLQFYFNEKAEPQAFTANTSDEHGLSYVGSYMLSETFPGIRFHFIKIPHDLEIQTYPASDDMIARIERSGSYLIMPLDDFHTLASNNGLSMRMTKAR